MARRSAKGTGTIRKKTVTRGGKKYEYWEARYTTGYDPGTGKQIQKTITGKTQREVSKKLKEATASLAAEVAADSAAPEDELPQAARLRAIPMAINRLISFFFFIITSSLSA